MLQNEPKETEIDHGKSVTEFLPLELDQVQELEPITISLQPDNEFLLYHRRVRHPPLLPWQIATIVSSVSMASRISLRFISLAVETIFNSLKFSAAASLGVTRRSLVAAVSSARSLHLMTFGRSEVPDDYTQGFFAVLDLYTNTGIYAIHASFSLAELICMSTFHIYSSAIRFTLDVSHYLKLGCRRNCTYI